MSTLLSRFRHMPPLAALVAGTGLMVCSGFFIAAHVATIIEVRDISIPIVHQLPVLERRLSALTEQIELTQLHAATRLGSQQEKVEMYALPEETDITRLIATFEVIREVLMRDGLLSYMSDIRISDPVSHDESMTRTVSVDVTVHDEGLQIMLLLVRLSGLLTVGDALTQQEIALLVDRIERENPTGIIAFEQFLSADLLKYAEDPRAYEEQLKRSFGNTSVTNALENVLRVSLLRDVRKVLRSDIGGVLHSYKLWPMQLMTLQDAIITPGSAPGWQKLSLTTTVYSARK